VSGGPPPDASTRRQRLGAARPGNRSPLQFRTEFERAFAFFKGRQSLQAILARRLLMCGTPDDDELADHLIRERRRRTRMDGSTADSLVLTARATWEMMELGAPHDHAGVVRMTGYLLNRQDQPGRWSEDGAAGNGFFSPGSGDEPIAPLALPSGTTFHDDDDARFVASCLALRAVLRAGHERRAAVRAHIEGLLSIRTIDPHLMFVALGALGTAPPEFGPRVAPLMDAVAERQLEDGSWPGVTIFHAADLILAVPTAAAYAAVRRAAPFIAGMQTASGAFDASESESIALIALRALDASRTAY